MSLTMAIATKPYIPPHSTILPSELSLSIIPMAIALSPLSFEDFLQTCPTEGRYEFVKGEIVRILATRQHDVDQLDEYQRVGIAELRRSLMQIRLPNPYVNPILIRIFKRSFHIALAKVVAFKLTRSHLGEFGLGDRRRRFPE